MRKPHRFESPFVNTFFWWIIDKITDRLVTFFVSLWNQRRVFPNTKELDALTPRKQLPFSIPSHQVVKNIHSYTFVHSKSFFALFLMMSNIRKNFINITQKNLLLMIWSQKRLLCPIENVGWGLKSATKKPDTKQSTLNKLDLGVLHICIFLMYCIADCFPCRDCMQLIVVNQNCNQNRFFSYLKKKNPVNLALEKL